MTLGTINHVLGFEPSKLQVFIQELAVSGHLAKLLLRLLFKVA
jgi:hypothetical protein